MMRTELTSRLKLAAVDLDGTLLGPDGEVSRTNLQAVNRLQEAGVQVVLASGRHFNNMRKYAAMLPGVQWLVSCQGGELSDSDRQVVLRREFFAEASAGKMLELGRDLGFSTLIYSISGVFTESDRNSGMDFYTDLAGTPPRQIKRGEILGQPLFKILWIGEPAEMDHVGGQLEKVSESVQAIRTHKRLWEFMPAGVSKASALNILAARLEVKPEEVVAFGDGDNDVPMFEWAGLSVAMPHGWPAAIRKASYTAPAGPADSAFARGVDLIFTQGHFKPLYAAAASVFARSMA
jgi:Cof subfamily protein (haloacid dehalogenase superfamily)